MIVGMEVDMEKYLCLFLVRIKNTFQYRINLLTGLPIQFIRAILANTIYIAFFTSTSNIDIRNLHITIAYVWLQNSFMSFISYWMVDSELNDTIRLGNVAYELVRPFNLYWFWFTKLISQRLIIAFFNCLPIFFIALFMPGLYTLKLNFTLTKIIIFIISIILALILNTVMSLIIYISVFQTFTITGSLLFFGTIGEFAGGLIIPLMLMPKKVQIILNFLPFRFSGDFPFRILIYNYSLSNIICGLLLQLFWIVLMMIIGKLYLKFNLSKVVIQGG